ncbi:hypothetical protein ZWY2020_036955 [Hordeum vulgare]|nr:hypothetical protein ZWY2020_036955 [Hordeum vulgare]
MDLSRSADLVLAVAVFLLCASAEDQLAVGDKLLAGQSLVSAGGAFALGFFSPDDAAGTATRWYLGIWYNGIPGLAPSSGWPTRTPRPPAPDARAGQRLPPRHVRRRRSRALEHDRREQFVVADAHGSRADERGQPGCPGSERR